MGKIALVAGGSGLVGRFCLKILENSKEYDQIIVPTRRSMKLGGKATEVILDFDHLTANAAALKAADYFCCLGTTIGKAGSKANFRKVDYEYVVALANIAKNSNARSFSLVSAMGASANSFIFYNRTKGEAEEALKKIGLSKLFIFRPSIIDGKREEERKGEKMWLNFMHFLGGIVPKNYRPIHAAQIAQSMITTAQHSTAELASFSSKEIHRITPKASIEHLLE